MIKIGEIYNGLRKIDVEGDIVEKEDFREVRSRISNDIHLVANATLEDDTGKIRLVLWNEDARTVDVGDRVRVSNGYATEYQGTTQLQAGKYGTLEVL